MSTEPTEPSTPPGPMTTTSREVRPTTKKATKSKTKRKKKVCLLPSILCALLEEESMFR